MIVHEPVPDNQVEGAPVTISAGIVDAGGVVASASVFYRAIGAPAFAEAPLNRVDGNSWRGQIPGAAVVLAGVQYYIRAVDDSGNAATDPDDAPVGAHLFSVSAEDRLGPQIEHQPIADGRPEGEDVLIEATADDPAGVANVRVYYRPAGFPFFQEAPLALADGVYTGRIPGFSVLAPAVEYYLRAADGDGNLSYAPAGAPAEP
ncbi:MAG: hypothetical protein KC620_21125, partial [Myxococcales bacterium]|nr:hypothetical protein [Myxococcales bacterium]